MVVFAEISFMLACHLGFRGYFAGMFPVVINNIHANKIFVRQRVVNIEIDKAFIR